MENLARPIQIKFRVTEQERNVIKQRMELIGITNMAQYMRKISERISVHVRYILYQRALSAGKRRKQKHQLDSKIRGLTAFKLYFEKKSRSRKSGKIK